MKSKLSVKNKKDIKHMKINKNTYIISNFHYVFSKPNFD